MIVNTIASAMNLSSMKCNKLFNISFTIPGMCVCCIDQQQSYGEQEIIEDYSLKMNKNRESFRSIWLDLWKLLVIQLQLQQKSKYLISSITDFVMFMITSNEVISFKTSLHYCVGREGGIWIAQHTKADTHCNLTIDRKIVDQ